MQKGCDYPILLAFKPSDTLVQHYHEKYQMINWKNVPEELKAVTQEIIHHEPITA